MIINRNGDISDYRPGTNGHLTDDPLLNLSLSIIKGKLIFQSFFNSGKYFANWGMESLGKGKNKLMEEKLEILLCIRATFLCFVWILLTGMDKFGHTI